MVSIVEALLVLCGIPEIPKEMRETRIRGVLTEREIWILLVDRVPGQLGAVSIGDGSALREDERLTNHVLLAHLGERLAVPYLKGPRLADENEHHEQEYRREHDDREERNRLLDATLKLVQVKSRQVL